MKSWFNEKQRFHAAILRDLIIEIFRTRPANLLFKGGTAISFFYGSDRFSQDLDFSSEGIDDYATIDDAIASFDNNYNYKITNNWEDEIYTKSRFRRYQLTFRYGVYEDVTVTIDYSTVKCALGAEKRDLANSYYASKINLMKAEEILAEKVRTIYARKKGRDIYDLHFLSVIKRTRISRSLISAKLEEYPELKGKRYSFRSFSQSIRNIKPYWNDLDGIVNNFSSINFDAFSSDILDIFRNI